MMILDRGLFFGPPCTCRSNVYASIVCQILSLLSLSTLGKVIVDILYFLWPIQCSYGLYRVAQEKIPNRAI